MRSISPQWGHPGPFSFPQQDHLFESSSQTINDTVTEQESDNISDLSVSWHTSDTTVACAFSPPSEQLNHCKRMARPWESEGSSFSQRKVAKLSNESQKDDDFSLPALSQKSEFPPISSAPLNPRFSFKAHKALVFQIVDSNEGKSSSELAALVAKAVGVPVNAGSLWGLLQEEGYRCVGGAWVHPWKNSISVAPLKPQFSLEKSKSLILEIVNSNKEKTLEQLTRLVAERIGVQVPRSSLGDFVQKNGYKCVKGKGWVQGEASDIARHRLPNGFFSSRKSLIFELADNNKGKTLSAFAVLLAEEMGVRVPPNSLGRFLSRSGYQYVPRQGWVKQKEG